MGFGLVSEIIEHLQIELQVTIALSLIHTLCSSLQHILRLFNLLCLYQLLPGDGSSDSMLTFLPAGDCLTTNSLLQPTPRLVAISHQSPTLLTAISRPSSNSSWPLLYSLGKDHTENTTSNSSSTVACVSCSHYLAMAVI
jgi:hypothetical protein